METILYLAHTQEDGSLPRIARETLAAALEISKGLSATLVAGLVGKDVKAAADEIADCGASKILGVSGDDFAVSRYASDAAALEALVKASGASLVLAPGSSRFNRVLPGVACRAGGRIDTKISGWNTEGGTLKVQRWYYRQRMAAMLTRQQRPWFLALESGLVAGWEGAAGSASVEAVSVALDADSKRTEVIGEEAASAGATTIRPDASVLLVAGAGWSKKQADGQTHVKDAENLILGFLDATQASLGSSKSLVDQSGEGVEVLSCLSHMNQIGQTGSSPRHAKGLSTCCHGEEPHAVGWRFVNERRAINLDANCGWAQGKTDVLYVADAFKVMTKVNELLAQKVS